MSIKNLKSFNRSLSIAIKRNKEQGLTLLKVVGLEALRRIVLKTPVDTGRARGNWQVSIDTTIENELEVTDPNGASTIETGNTVIEGLTKFSTIHIANNVPYILALENGHSQRSPDGMVAVTLQELQTAL